MEYLAGGDLMTILVGDHATRIVVVVVFVGFGGVTA